MSDVRLRDAPLRVVSPLLVTRPWRALGGRASLHLVERHARVYRHMWLVLISGIGEPVFYLLAIGVGLSHLVGGVAGPAGRPIAYAQFVAPALLASSAMTGAINDSTFNVFWRLKYAKLYDSVLVTPMRASEVALGEIAWALIRGGLYAAAFSVVLLAMGLLHTAWPVLLIPAALLTGFGFAGAGMAATTFMRSWQDFEYVTVATLPLFLFSTTFYPLGVYPRALQIVVECTPLYQAVTLIRGLALGVVGPGLLWHAAYLAVLGLSGLLIAGRRVSRLLLT
jgi:lipooligosaccharide transport system permease protein